MAKVTELPAGWYDQHVTKYGAEVAASYGLAGVQWRSDRPSAYSLHVHQDSRGRWRWDANMGRHIAESGWEDTATEAMRAVDRWADRPSKAK
jgi:hypothetical protein